MPSRCISVLPLCLLVAGAPLASAAEGRGFSKGPQPAWAKPVPVDVPEHAPVAQIRGGIYHLLSDRQVRVSGAVRELYAHFARQVLNEAGLENASQISIEYDPGYQQLVLNQVQVRRGGVWQDRLAGARIQLLQREPELESQVYDGTVSAVVFVHDLRVGDVLDYAFTLRGSNPVLGGRYYDSFFTEWSVPLHVMRMRLLWPRGRPLFVRNHRSTLAPVTRSRGAESEMVWEQQDPVPIEGEASVPSSHDTFAWVQMS